MNVHIRQEGNETDVDIGVVEFTILSPKCHVIDNFTENHLILLSIHCEEKVFNNIGKL